MTLVAISPNAFGPDPGRTVYRLQRLEYVDVDMQALVRSVGAMPVMAGTGGHTASEALEELAHGFLDHCQALILSGGEDVGVDPIRDDWEKALLEAALERERPVLGICRGIQLMNVALGGSLVDDLPTDRPSSVSHRADDRAPDHSHALQWSEDVARWEQHVGARPSMVNSVHHQGIDRLASALTPMATTDDGLVEAVMHHDRPDVIAVQWHPEWMPGDATQHTMVARWLEHCR